MNKAMAVALMVVGVVLIIFGINASESFGSEVSKAFTGNPTDKSMWLLLGGIGLAVLGAVFAFGRSKA